MFQSRRGMSPLRFVTERRLAAAQRSLSAATQRDDVTRVALGLGFNHAGRFSALYRQTFGELPSETLKRAFRRRHCDPFVAAAGRTEHAVPAARCGP